MTRVLFSIYCIIALCASSAVAHQDMKDLPPGYMRIYAGQMIPSPEVTFDVVAVQILKVNKAKEGLSSFDYKVIKTYRQHPNPNKRVPVRGTANYAPVVYPQCGTGYHGPIPPKAGSKVILLGSRQGQFVKFVNKSLNQIVEQNVDNSKFVHLPLNFSAANEISKYPDQENAVLALIAKRETTRQKWLNWCKTNHGDKY